ncbi:MAG: tRNA lysidine(34) synthetase TilS [Candidatus Moranbacteria bacterium]|nr:tRNA lysidine(34) synthetase TilS [Candidatus Moranbacteria bacterium]
MIACSGGPDSVALLHVFLSLRDKLRLRIGVIHVNYRIRGEESDGDESFVRILCDQYDVPCYVFRPKIVQGRNEEELRDIRYRYFEKILRIETFDHIVTAHTEDDQAETVLIRLLRGTGPYGLAAMRPRHGAIIRPFLEISKKDILEFLRSEKLTYRTDKTNDDTTILRNRIRHELIPLLDRDYRKGVRKTLARTARLLDEHFEKKVADFHGLQTCITPGGLSFSRNEYLCLTPPDRTAEIRRLYRIVLGVKKYPTAALIREAEKLISSYKSKVRTYSSLWLKIEARGDRVTMIRNKQ